MTNYIDYTYYSSVFGGSLIPETDFEKTATKASNYVRLRILNRNITGFESAVKNCTCEVAEIVYKHNQLKKNYQEMIENISSGNNSGIVTSEKVGDYSVSKASLSMSELKVLCSDAELQLQVNDEINSSLLFTGLLYQGIDYVRDI